MLAQTAKLSGVIEAGCMDFFVISTWFGSLYLLLPLTVLLCFMLALHGNKEQVFLVSLSLLSTIITVHLAKLLFRRPRPFAAELLVEMPSDWSFPSAHTAQATAFFLSCTFVAFRMLPPLWAAMCAFASLLLVSTVGYSRVYLKVHYVSDVLAGFLLAVLIVLAVRHAISIIPWLRNG